MISGLLPSIAPVQSHQICYTKGAGILNTNTSMNDNHMLALIVTYYLSKFDKDAYTVQVRWSVADSEIQGI